MRLTCPNCGAQYEVPDGVIPPEGLDVQCSNCGNTWFQDQDADPAQDIQPVAQDDFEPQAEAEVQAEDDVWEDAVPEQSDAEPELPAEEPASAFHDTDPAPLDEDEWPEEEPEVEAPGQARGLDPAISDILKEEAERESQLRADEELGGLESQPELGLDATSDDEPSRRARQARDRMAHIKGEQPSAKVIDDRQGSRRGVLPDIDEINSTLRATESAVAPAGVEAIVPPPRKTGFARGFALMLIFAAILVVIYHKAPDIAQAVPQADPMLSAYVALVDQARLWLDMVVSPLLNGGGEG